MNHKKNLILLIFLLVPTLFQGCRSFSDDKKPSALASARTFAGLRNEFGEPFGIASKDGEIFVADGERGKILKITEDGRVETFADKLDTPSQIVFDARGDLIVADSGSHTIKKVLPTGEIELIAGAENEKGFQDGEAFSARFNAPVGVAVFENKIFVADTYNDKIRLIENGKVRTVAGGERGFSDGSEARFDTPLGLAAWTDGKILVADSENRRIRVVEPTGRTWTLAGNGTANSTDGLLSDAEFLSPAAIAVDETGSIFIADANSVRAIGRRFIPILETIAGGEQGFFDAGLKRAKFNRPSGLAFDSNGNLFVADAENALVRVLTGTDIGRTLTETEFDRKRISAEEFRKLSAPRWTFDPPDKMRDIAGTLGEIRGRIENENSEAWFHNGLDIAGGYGETVRFIRDEKVLRPRAVQNFETVRELLRMPTIGYIHIRIGRDAEQIPFDDPRFQFEFGEDEKPKSIRIARGTKFKAGEAIGTLNRYNHVHLVAGRTGREFNALDALVFPNVADARSPSIENVRLIDENWNEYETEENSARIKLAGKIRVVVQAFDQMDGNADRRKLGLYKIGYQVLAENREPLAGFETPKWNIVFDRPPERESIGLVYAPGSQSGATGATIFRYIATNEVSGKTARENFLNLSEMKPGKYVLRVLVADYFGNTASEDLEFEKN